MADFSSVGAIYSNIGAARDILRIFKNIFSACVEVEVIFNRYQSDPAFKSEADHLFTQAQLTEIGQMVSDTVALRQEWEAAHSGPISA